MNEQQSTELPDEIEVNGIKYRRVDDYTDDRATRLLQRIEGVAKASGCGAAWAAWAVAAIYDNSNGRPITPWPR